MPVKGDASGADEQSISSGPRTPVSSAMVAKVGAAAKDSQSAAPKVAVLPPGTPADPLPAAGVLFGLVEGRNIGRQLRP
ncbi:hypothetical protein [Sinorhizobium psoraleae]|uniref:hypothetical protein n=1 Tax=Sinorhizobium psoraleae TaxID=520838 RepID=UPI0035E3DD68